MTNRSMCLLNEHGDVTIVWDAQNDEKMLEIIRSKMEQGITFFKVEPGLLFFNKTKRKITSPSQVGYKREIVVSDKDFEVLFKAGIVSQQSRQAESEIKTIGIAKTAEEVARSHTVGVRRTVGG